MKIIQTKSTVKTRLQGSKLLPCSTAVKQLCPALSFHIDTVYPGLIYTAAWVWALQKAALYIK